MTDTTQPDITDSPFYCRTCLRLQPGKVKSSEIPGKCNDCRMFGGCVIGVDDATPLENLTIKVGFER
jgi:hypothetical protein